MITRTVPRLIFLIHKQLNGGKIGRKDIRKWREVGGGMTKVSAILVFACLFLYILHLFFSMSTRGIVQFVSVIVFEDLAIAFFFRDWKGVCASICLCVRAARTMRETLKHLAVSNYPGFSPQCCMCMCVLDMCVCVWMLLLDLWSKSNTDCNIWQAGAFVFKYLLEPLLQALSFFSTSATSTTTVPVVLRHNLV